LTRSDDQSASLIKWTYGLVNRIVMLVDAVFLLGSTFVFWLESPTEVRPLTWLQAGAVAVITLIMFHTVIRATRSYRVERYERFHRSVIDPAIGTFLASFPAMLIVVAFMPEAAASLRWLLWWIVTAFVALVIGRQVVRLMLLIVRRKGLLRRRVAIVGAGPQSEAIARRLSAPANRVNYKVVGQIDPTTNQLRRPGGQETGSAIDLVRYAQNYGIDMVIVALPWEKSAEILALTRRLQWIAADVVVPVDVGGLRPQFTQQPEISDGAVLQLMHRPFKGSQGLFKVVEDYLVAAIGLLVTFPIMVAAAIAVKMEGSGPIFFKQPRVGFNSKPFMMYKFRTMTVDLTDDGSRGTSRDSQRITRVGRFLRRTSIDELPQLVNVLRGEMSVVGPRPHVPNMLVGEGVYSEVVQQYAARHRIKPGITGWAQINGMRGGIDSLEKANRGAELDLYYIANWSPKLDVKIMLRTVFAGLVGRNVF
jgi:putative colanic acid biosynthesis UDP-glucose lipid carrier transferase